MNVYLWQYVSGSRNYSGHHLTADAEGAVFLREKFGELEAANNNERIEIPLSSVTKRILDVPGYHAPTTQYRNWVVEVDPSANKEFFEIFGSQDSCTLRASPAQAGCVLQGIIDIQKGEGDYCIGGDKDHVIWFWWHID